MLASLRLSLGSLYPGELALRAPFSKLTISGLDGGSQKICYDQGWAVSGWLVGMCLRREASGEKAGGLTRKEDPWSVDQILPF